MYSLKCSYYKKSFRTIDELLNDLVECGMDLNYNGKSMGEKAIDLLVM